MVKAWGIRWQGLGRGSNGGRVRLRWTDVVDSERGWEGLGSDGQRGDTERREREGGEREFSQM